MFKGSPRVCAYFFYGTNDFFKKNRKHVTCSTQIPITYVIKKSIKGFQTQKIIYQFVFTQIPTKQRRNLHKSLYAFKQLKKKPT
jgi:hypothetical protein